VRDEISFNFSPLVYTTQREALAWIFAKGKGTQKIPLKPARYEL
jgi:hypothetical protein